MITNKIVLYSSISHFIISDFIPSQILLFFFNILKVFDKRELRSPVSAVFSSDSFSHFVSVSHFGNYCSISNYYQILWVTEGPY